MVKPILANRGIVIDFAGDGILAVYGAPADDPDHAWHAVRSAVRMDWRVMATAGAMRSLEMFLNFPVLDMNRNVLWRDPEQVDPADVVGITRFLAGRVLATRYAVSFAKKP